MDSTYVFERQLKDIADELKEILSEYPETNGGYDYLLEAESYINKVIDEYME